MSSVQGFVVDWLIRRFVVCEVLSGNVERYFRVYYLDRTFDVLLDGFGLYVRLGYEYYFEYNQLKYPCCFDYCSPSFFDDVVGCFDGYV